MLRPDTFPLAWGGGWLIRSRRLSLRCAIPVVLVALLHLPRATAAPPPKSVSTSRQFIVYAAEPMVRAGLCDLGERTKRHLLSLLQQRDEWKTPIVVYAAASADLGRADTADSRLSFSQTGFGLKIQLDLSLRAGLDSLEIERALLRSVLLEMMYRNAPETPAGTPYVEPADWLVEGTLALENEGDASAIAAALSGPAGEGKVPAFVDFLQQRPALLESPLRSAYRACSAALVSMLIDSHDGPTQLGRMIAVLSRVSGDQIPALRACFPELFADSANLEARWQHAVARLAARGGSQVLSCAETERALSALLNAAVPAPGTAFSLEEFPQFVRSHGSGAALKHLAEGLLVLSGRANPIYAPLLAEYREVTLLLARGKTHRVGERLARLRGNREAIVRRLSTIEDYMNWFEATQAHTASGAFNDYMKAARLQTGRASPRHDPISVYLDAMEMQLRD